jgi:hypothetical protein
MNNHQNQQESAMTSTKSNHRHGPRLKVPAALLVLLLIMLGVRVAVAQSIPQPVLAITSMTTNQLVITITNGVDNAAYDLLTTSALENPNYPWQRLTNGLIGQTNFTVTIGPEMTSFYQVVLDVNTVPAWEAADPNNPSAGVLEVFIDSPINGSNLTQ